MEDIEEQFEPSETEEEIEGETEEQPS